MSLGRLVYRFGQFRRHLGSRVVEAELVEARKILTSAQMELFLQMSAGEQAHSLEVLRRLEAQGETDPDLQAAALLHDAGKTHRPLRLWERVWIVLGGGFLRRVAASEGLEQLPWWQKPLAVAEQHPAWGAELARAAGCSPRAASLIRRHQEKGMLNLQAEEDVLLRKLQAVDDES
jgi:putative nucleotidyltransferase with HDIG domain